MERMKFSFAFILLILTLLQTACSVGGVQDSVSDETVIAVDNSDAWAVDSEIKSDEEELSQIKKDLQGTWLYSRDDCIQKVVFDDDDYISLFVADGNEFVDIGFYDLSDGIATTTFNSDGSSVKGHVSYEYENDTLKLIAADGSYLIKISDNNSLSWSSNAIVHSGNRQDVENDILSDDDDIPNTHLPSNNVATIGDRNALVKAKEYLSFMAFSYHGLVEQLEYEGYSHSEAVYGADNCDADWNEQAAKKASEYLDIMAFSCDGLIEQLEYEGFTHDQAVYGAQQNGF